MATGVFDDLMRELMGECPRGDALAVVRCGSVDYDLASSLQERLHEVRVAGRVPDVLLLLEHPAVYTLGRRAELDDLGSVRGGSVPVRRIDRGGAVTFHGPGQLVGYPVVALRDRGIEVRAYVRALEEAVIRTVATWGVRGERRPGAPGVWVGTRKLASIGVRVRRWVTTHGFALNVTTDLAYFGAIVPCAMPDVEMTSLAREGIGVGVDDVSRAFGPIFQSVLGYSILACRQARIERGGESAPHARSRAFGGYHG